MKKRQRSEKTLRWAIRNNRQTFKFQINIKQDYLIKEATQIARIQKIYTRKKS